MMRWRERAPYTDKVLALDPRFRPSLEAFLDALEREHIWFALGDCRRTVEREWELWKIGRACQANRAGANVNDPNAWTVVEAKKVVTRVPPGSGKGPHFFGLAADVYPLDATHLIMKASNPDLTPTLQLMWALAEKCGLDALGHRTEEPGDEYVSWDPCHVQQLRWKETVEQDRLIKERV